MIPLGSSKYDVGMACIRYKPTTSLPHCCRSDTWTHSKPSASMSRTHAPVFPSSDTPSTVTPLSLYRWYCATMFGFSSRHGTHHDAQKSSKVYFPLKSE